MWTDMAEDLLFNTRNRVSTPLESTLESYMNCRTLLPHSNTSVTNRIYIKLTRSEEIAYYWNMLIP